MAAKCNITELVIEEMNSLFYGFACKNNSCKIIENYIEYLNCDSVNLKVCNPSDCVNNPIVFNCEFNITGLTLSVDGNTLTYSLDSDNYVGGTTPFVYEWEFEEDDFIVSGPINTSQLVLLLKEGKVLDNLVTKIKVTVTDTNGCTDTKECWFNKGDLKCSQNFVPCPNPSELMILDNFVQCSGPSGLIITEI